MDQKVLIFELWNDYIIVLTVLFDDSLRERSISFVELRSFVDEMHDSLRIVLYHLNNRLVVLKLELVAEFLKSLPVKLILLLFKDVRDIELLKFLIGKVDEKLFERIVNQDLKSKNI